MDNNDLANVTGKCDICLKMSNGSFILLRDVKHAPDVHLNLVSIGLLDDDDGYGNKFFGHKWKISQGSLILGKSIKLKDNLYVLQASISDALVNVVG